MIRIKMIDKFIKDKLQITSLKFEGVWILHPNVL